MCPRGTTWCSEHEADADQCISTSITVATGCSVWLQQELPGIEPVMVVDTAPSGAELSTAEALALADAVHRLQGLVTGMGPGDPPVQSV